MFAAWLAFSVLAAEVVPTGPLLPGLPALVEVGGGDPSRVTLSAGGALVVGLPPRGAVARFEVVPPLAADTIELVADVDGQTVRSIERLALPGTATVQMPPRVEAPDSSATVEIPVIGDGAQLQVASSDGAVRVVAGPEGGTVIELTPGPGGGAREIIVSARDATWNARPAFSVVRIRVRRVLAFATEPGTTLEVVVGERRYGPTTANADGAVSLTIDQFPGETHATAVLSDDLGNATRSDVALGTSGGAAALVVPLGLVTPGRPAPPLWIRGVREDGLAWSGRAPSCRVPGGEIEVREIEPGNWLGVLPARRQVLDALRVACTFGATSIVQVLHANADTPDHLSLVVFPTDLASEDPTADVRAVLVDAAGNRLPGEGVSLSAERGAVRASLSAGTGVVAGTYDGTGLGSGDDRVHARWTPRPVSGGVAKVTLAWPEVRGAGLVPVWARVLDALDRPVVGVRVGLEVGAVRAEGPSRGDGWFHALFPVDGSEVVRATAEGIRCAGILGPGDPGLSDPGGALLEAQETVHIRVGVVTGILLTVDPPVLRAGPGSYALVSVRLSDRTGKPVSGAQPVLEASAGRFGPASPRADGVWVAEWYPDGLANATRVEVAATVEDVRSSTRLEVAPRSLSPSLMPFVGVLSNFGAIHAAVVGLELDLRFRAGWAGDTLSFRATAGSYGWTDAVETGLGAPVSARSLLVPVVFSGVLRRDFGHFGGEAGIGIASGIQRVEERIGSRVVATGVDLLVGPAGLVSLSRRAAIGEVALTVRGTFLPGPSGDVGWSGNLGGVSADVGYRLLF